jgi:hypothetical protein
VSFAALACHLAANFHRAPLAPAISIFRDPRAISARGVSA